MYVYVYVNNVFLSNEFVTPTIYKAAGGLTRAEWIMEFTSDHRDLGSRRQHRFEKPEAAGTSSETWAGYRRYILVIWLSTR